MKANAPEKIYLPIDDYLETYACRDSDQEIEYIRTDAFIDKAKKWFEEHFGNRIKWEFTTYEFEDMQSMVEGFRNYMKEE